MDSYIVTILPGGRITIPAAIRKNLDLRPGDALIWFEQDRELHFRKAQPHELEALGAQTDGKTSFAPDIDRQSARD